MRRNRIQPWSAAVLSLGLFATTVIADDFDFKDPKGVNAIYFVLDSEIEPIMGMAAGISGSVEFDPKAPKATTGKIVIETSSVNTSNSTMTRYLHSKDWLDAEGHETIEFEFKKITKVESPRENIFELTTVGDFTCKGVTKEIKVVVQVAHLPGKLGSRQRGKSGDLLVLRVDFTIKRSDFGIKPGQMEQAVADEIEVKVRIVGGHAED